VDIAEVDYPVPSKGGRESWERQTQPGDLDPFWLDRPGVDHRSDTQRCGSDRELCRSDEQGSPREVPHDVMTVTPTIPHAIGLDKYELLPYLILM
jgi:hypothetical protein